MGIQAHCGPTRGAGGHCFFCCQPSPYPGTVLMSQLSAQVPCPGGCVGRGGLSPVQDQVFPSTGHGVAVPMVTLGMGLGLMRLRRWPQADRTAGMTVLMYIMMMRSCCWHMLNKVHGCSSGHPGKGQRGQTNDLFLGTLLFQLCGGTTQKGRASSGHTSFLENWKIAGELTQSALRHIPFLPSLMWFGCISGELAEGDGVSSV